MIVYQVILKMKGGPKLNDIEEDVMHFKEKHLAQEFAARQRKVQTVISATVKAVKCTRGKV